MNLEYTKSLVLFITPSYCLIIIIIIIIINLPYQELATAT